MIEKAGKILTADSRYAWVQLTNHTENSFFAKLHTLILPKHSSTANTTIRARNSIYAQPNDTVIVGMSAPLSLNPFSKKTGNCIDTSAIILRTTPIAETVNKDYLS